MRPVFNIPFEDAKPSRVNGGPYIGRSSHVNALQPHILEFDVQAESGCLWYIGGYSLGSDGQHHIVFDVDNDWILITTREYNTGNIGVAKTFENVGLVADQRQTITMHVNPFLVEAPAGIFSYNDLRSACDYVIYIDDPEAANEPAAWFVASSRGSQGIDRSGTYAVAKWDLDDIGEANSFSDGARWIWQPPSNWAVADVSANVVQSGYSTANGGSGDMEIFDLEVYANDKYHTDCRPEQLAWVNATRQLELPTPSSYPMRVAMSGAGGSLDFGIDGTSIGPRGPWEFTVTETHTHTVTSAEGDDVLCQLVAVRWSGHEHLQNTIGNLQRYRTALMAIDDALPYVTARYELPGSFIGLNLEFDTFRDGIAPPQAWSGPLHIWIVWDLEGNRTFPVSLDVANADKAAAIVMHTASGPSSNTDSLPIADLVGSATVTFTPL